MPGPLVYVLVYALETRNGIVLVDAGWASDEALADVEHGLRTAGASLDDVRGVLFTHAHLDHYGLGGRLREVTGAWLALHPRDAETLDGVASDERPARVERWLVENGVPRRERDELIAVTNRVPQLHARPDRLLGGGPVADVEPWRIEAIETPGHSPGHLCFSVEEAGVVFTGDHILSDTTPNVSIFPGGDGNPLAEYLASLELMVPYGDMFALPGHESRVAVGPRARDLLRHHDEQLADAQRSVTAGAETVRAVAEAMSWTRPWRTFGPFDRMLALGEARAHLVLLAERRRVQIDAGQTLAISPV